MFTRIAAFELGYQLRSPLFSVSFALFFLLTFAATTIDQVQIGNAGQVFRNAPFALLQTVGIMNLFGLFVVTAFVANAVVRDDETGFAPILRATRLRKPDYVLGRFVGSTTVACLVMAAVPIGVLVGSLMPWQDPEKIGPFILGHYAYALFVYSVPTVLVMAAGFFALATATRSMMWCYVGVIAFLVLYTASQMMLSEPELEELGSLLDPFAIGALFDATKYWTVSERNTRLPELTGGLLHNRILWLSLGAVLLAVAYTVFRPEASQQTVNRKGKSVTAAALPTLKPLARPAPGYSWAALRAMIRLDMLFVLRSPAFAVLLALGLFNALGGLSSVAEMGGVPYFPVTRAVVEMLTGAFAIIPLIIAIYYGGELVWRDRDYRMHEIVDATATPSWVFVLPKVLAMGLVLLSSLLIAMLGAVLFQLTKGYTHLQLGSYLLWFVLPVLIGSLQYAILSIFVQTLVPSKAAGWAVMLLQVVASIALATTGFEHRLYNFGDAAPVPLSDMNGLGHFWIARAWHQFYWTVFALMLLVGAHLLWRRGTETRLRPRFVLAPIRLRGPAGVLMGLFAIVWVGSGAYIFYNSNVLNRYITEPEQEQILADAERVLLPLETLPQPKVAHVNLDVALYPRERLAVTTGEYTLVNRHDVPVLKLIVSTPRELAIEKLDMSSSRLETTYEEFGVRIYTLDEPMAPGETRKLRFVTRLQEQGFPNSDPQTRLVSNGTFINNAEISPLLGIDRTIFLRDRATRRKYDLPEELRVASLEDETANSSHYLRPDSDWVTADIRLSTDADQTPVAPGMTVSDTTADGRRTVITRSEAPIQHFFSLQSARYARADETWMNLEGSSVALAVYYHPEHEHNVQRMLDAMKISLDVFSKRFSPFQFQQARILEFPAYAGFAQSFANTVPYSESIGFIQNFREEDQDDLIDLVTYVTAHEIAHQWWAHQLIGANKQGMTLLSETFSQYSALLVMEQLYGKPQIRRFLKRELDRYLRSRGTEAVEELPLSRVEDQGYIHYNKGAVAMYGLKEIIGEDAVNRALQALLKEFAFKGAPYPDTRDFLRLLRAETDGRYEQVIVDLFEKMTIYDLAAREPVVRELSDGRFETTFVVDARKHYADGEGKETEAPLDEEFDVGAFSEEPGTKAFSGDSVLAMTRSALKSGTQTVRLVTEQRPVYIGVDPYNLRIDRNSDDNVATIED